MAEGFSFNSAPRVPQEQPVSALERAQQTLSSEAWEKLETLMGPLATPEMQDTLVVELNALGGAQIERRDTGEPVAARDVEESRLLANGRRLEIAFDKRGRATFTLH